MDTAIVAEKIDGVLSTLVSIPEPQRTAAQLEVIDWGGVGRNLIINVLGLAITGGINNALSDSNDCLSCSIDILANVINRIADENEITAAELLLRIGCVITQN